MPRQRYKDNSIEVIWAIAFVILFFFVFVRWFAPAVFYGSLVFMVVAVIGFLGFKVLRHRSRPELAPSALPTSIPGKDQTPALKPPISFTPNQLIEQLRRIDWYQFEQVVALLYRKRGFEIERRGGANPDGGIDLIVTNRAGEKTAIQCKQWKAWNVGVKTVREFLGALKVAGMDRGIFITLRGYTEEARRIAQGHNIEVLDEAALRRLLELTDAKYDPAFLALLNATKKFCPKCDHEMVLRTASSGPNAGGQFWGCSRFPHCRFIMKCAENGSPHFSQFSRHHGARADASVSWQDVSILLKQARNAKSKG